MKDIDEVRANNAVFVAGQLIGLSWKLDADALEQFLESQTEDSDFRGVKQCRAAIAFKRAIEE